VAQLLHDLGDSRALAALIGRLLHDRDPRGRAWAAATLTRLCDPNALPELVHAERSERDHDVRYAMAEAITHTLSNLLMDKVTDRTPSDLPDALEEPCASNGWLRITLSPLQDTAPYDPLLEREYSRPHLRQLSIAQLAPHRALVRFTCPNGETRRAFLLVRPDGDKYEALWEDLDIDADAPDRTT
jgi:HEAT repeat protein